MTVEAINRFDINNDGILSKQEFGDVLSLLKGENTRDSEEFKNNFRDLFGKDIGLQNSLLENINKAFSTGNLSEEQIIQMSKAHMYLFGKPFRFEGVDIGSITPEKALDNFIGNENIPVELKTGFIDFMTDVIEGNSAFDLSEFDINKDGRLNYVELKELREALNKNISSIIELGSYKKFRKVTREIDGGIKMFAIPKKGIRDLISYISGMDSAQSEQLLSAKYGEENFEAGLIYGLKREIPGQVEDLFKLMADLKLLQTFNKPLMQYLECVFEKSVESKMKAEALKEAHPFIAMISIAEKPVEAVKGLWNMLSNPSGWTAGGISTALSAFADPVAMATGPTIVTKASNAINKAGKITAKAMTEAAENTVKMMSGPELAYATVRVGADDLGKVTRNLARKAEDLAEPSIILQRSATGESATMGERLKGWLGGGKKEVPKSSKVSEPDMTRLEVGKRYVNRTLPEERPEAYLVTDKLDKESSIDRIVKFEAHLEIDPYISANGVEVLGKFKKDLVVSLCDTVESHITFYKNNPSPEVQRALLRLNKKLGKILESEHSTQATKALISKSLSEFSNK